MRILIGGVLGFIIGALIYIIAALSLGISLFGLFTNLVPVVNTLMLGLGSTNGIFVAVFATLIIYIFAYTLATIGLLGPIASTRRGPLPTAPLEEFMRGFIVGITAALNFGVWLLFIPTVGILIGFIVALTGFLTVFPAIARTSTYQLVLGWTSWLMPMSYLVSPIGFALFVLNAPFAIATFGIAAFRLDWLTGTVETTGGAIVAIRPFGLGASSTGFNLGNFTFLRPPTGVGLAIRTDFASPGLSAHETGHTLTVAAFGGVFGWINAVDQNIPPFRRGGRAYGELIAESHFPRPRPRHIRVWS